MSPRRRRRNRRRAESNIVQLRRLSPRAGLLLEILSFARPHDSETERRFNREFLDPIPGMEKDGFGNRILRIGDKPRIMWSCHVDTVASRCGPQQVAYSPSTGLLSLANGRAGQSLGADDGAGVWILLNMIEAGVEGLYVFHRGEEAGCLGSRWILENTPELLDGIDAAIAFDRAGERDIITHQASGMTASDDFAMSLAGLLNTRSSGLRFRPDDTGVFTDTNTYSGVIPECSNVSVGYDMNHGPRETLNVGHCEALLDAVLAADFSKLEIVRQPGEGSYRYGSGPWSRGTGYGESHGQFDEMLEMVRRYPEAAAELLLSCLVAPHELAIHADGFGSEMPEDDDPWWEHLHGMGAH